MWLKNTTNTGVKATCCCKVYTIRSQRAQLPDIACHPADNTPDSVTRRQSSICGNAGTVPGRFGEERAELQGEALKANQSVSWQI